MKVGHEIPANATASRVMAKGIHFEYKANESSSDSDLPLATREIDEALTANPSFVNLTGMVVGRLKVVGLSTKNRRWVCRCSCGRYVLRKALALTSGTTAGAPCDQCYLLALAKKHDLLRRTGKIRNTEDFIL
ncbi:hypothetical protein [Pseudomonas sp. FW300-N2A2]|uniref:hypothetical protein n=1 Tax=Pseudomonas sp. FW300-N2A2 TaxID=2751316 RepID=UPI001A9333BA|nr:hypothetical protein [Pseudomonas sp. FW300-N2A2]